MQTRGVGRNVNGNVIYLWHLAKSCSSYRFGAFDRDSLKRAFLTQFFALKSSSRLMLRASAEAQSCITKGKSQFDYRQCTVKTFSI